VCSSDLLKNPVLVFGLALVGALYVAVLWRLVS
jgi:hypothetical protein